MCSASPKLGAGTFCTEILAFLGADVVQIETVRRPDVWRGAGSPVPPAVRRPDLEQSGINTNGMYNTVNLNKRAITLDVTHPRGKEMFWDLIPGFDVLVDNFSPHVMTNWGVTLETLHERRPDMIFASVSGYGRQGPLAEYPANGATTEPMAGLASIHGYEGDEPMNTGGLIPDPISGYYLAAAIVASIHHRQRTGVGQRIDAAMIEAVAVQVGDAILECDVGGDIRAPQGNRHPRFAPHGIYRTANDEWLALATESGAEFAALAGAMNRPELAQEARFAGTEARKANEAALDEIVAAWLAERDAAVTAEALGKAGVHAARVEPFKPIYAGSNPQWQHRGFLAPVPHPESGTHLMPLMPWVFAHTPRGDVRHSPLFGQHSREVFAAGAWPRRRGIPRTRRAGSHRHTPSRVGPERIARMTAPGRAQSLTRNAGGGILSPINRRKAMRLKTALAACCALAAATVWSGEIPVAEAESVGMSTERLLRIDAAMQRHIDAGDIQGAVTVVARRGKVVHFKAHGLMDVEAGTPMADDAIFIMMSSTKPVLGVAAMMMIEEGLMRPTDPVSKYIPEFEDMQVAVLAEPADEDVSPYRVDRENLPAHRLVPAATPITIQHLLTHTSGLASGGLGSVVSPNAERTTLAEYIPTLGNAILDFQPGSRWAYSGGNRSRRGGAHRRNRLQNTLRGVPADTHL